MRKTKEEALLTRENLLTAALHVFSQNGYSSTRLVDIAEAAGVTRGAIYHHFGSKQDLFKALVTERETEVNQLAEDVISEGHSPLETLRILLVRLFEYLAGNDEYRAMLELALSKVELTAELDDFAKATLRGRRLLTRALSSLISAGIRSGEIRPDLRAKDAAIALSGFMNGIGLIWVQDPESFSLQRRAENLVDIIIKGVSL